MHKDKDGITIELKLRNHRIITPIMTLEQLIAQRMIISSGSRQHKCSNVLQTHTMVQDAAS